MPARRPPPPTPDGQPRWVPLSHRRALVVRSTRLQPVPGVRGIRLHLAGDVTPVWQATEAALGVASLPIPFWAFAWAGGLALARYLQEHPVEVRGRRVLDLATGSGLVAIAAALAGAASVSAADIDPFAGPAVRLNTRANGVRVDFVGRDLLDEAPPAVDVVLAADTWYEGALADRVLPWLRAAATRGARVLIGDPGRRYLPLADLVALATYDVLTTTQLEDRPVVRAQVFTIGPAGGAITPLAHVARAVGRGRTIFPGTGERELLAAIGDRTTRTDGRRAAVRDLFRRP